jgi:hypothetical protein
MFTYILIFAEKKSNTNTFSQERPRTWSLKCLFPTKMDLLQDYEKQNKSKKKKRKRTFYVSISLAMACK